ncbi:Calcium/calmodulin-dependent protein kinase I [Lachnellula arida]|uniref:Calcium/calmodulin-dependent protein kinase I n=1 Tax=Lachnellula arida TaxID=1316785 RepID=A0A8T9BIE9_9HELO|nr:Calcium/calmodulin-dependent protein kinase I [Lachnellula arida]
MLHEAAEPDSPSSLATDSFSKSGSSEVPWSGSWTHWSDLGLPGGENFVLFPEDNRVESMNYPTSLPELSSFPAQATLPLSTSQEENQANSMKIEKRPAHELSSIPEFPEQSNIRHPDMEGSQVLQTYQMQSMPMEHQRKKRLIMARQDERIEQRGERSNSVRSPKKDVDNTRQSMADSADRGPLSDFNPGITYYSAYSSPWTGNTPGSIEVSPAYYSAQASPAVVLQTSSAVTQSMGPPKKLASEYIREARLRGLILPPNEELNWSGKSNGGQHVEFEQGTEVPLQVLGPIGMSLTATVDKVRCRRILLARKTMKCGRRFSLQDAFAEVEHLQKLRHPHIIQLVGSYLQGRKFAVLLYPVADYDLGSFFDEVLPLTSTSSYSFEAPVEALRDFFNCLVEALIYIHSCETKHLDIKPANILVKRSVDYLPHSYRVYIADFGISRSFPATDHSQTDAEILRTPKYCPLEVWNRETHGRAADIFAMGCVFMEMFTVLSGIDLDVFSDFRSQGLEERIPYRNSLGRVLEWSVQLRPKVNWVRHWHLDWTLDMLAEDPEKRSLPANRLYFNTLKRLRQEKLRESEEEDAKRCPWCWGTREVYRAEP